MSAWKDFVTTALLGTERGVAPVLPASLEPALATVENFEREKQFLMKAGALALWRRAGWQPPHSTSTCEAAGPEELPLISHTSYGHLRLMLENRHSTILPEWLDKAARTGRRIPPELLPALLERSRGDRALRPHLLAAGGKRAAWLAAQNPAWAFLAAADAPESWETGTREQRIAVLRRIRSQTPADAREKIQAVWNIEPADTRAAFLAELRTNLCEADTPFLETVLDDRSKEVRYVAVDLLARLFESPFIARMKARATPLVVFKPGKFLTRASLDITLPIEPDAAAARDGLDGKSFGQQKKLGEKAVLLVLLLSAVPLDHWTDLFRQTPAALLKALEKSEFAHAVVTGFAWATLRQRNAAWADALLDYPIKPFSEFLPREPLLGVLPTDRRADRLTALIRAGSLDKPSSEEWAACASALVALADWPAPIAREVLSALRRAAASGIPSHLRPSIELLLNRIPFALLPEAIKGWPADKEGVAPITELLIFRHDALTALHQQP